MVSFILAVIGSSNHVGARAELLLGFYSPVSRAWEFGLGALVALLSPTLTRLTSKRWLAGTSAIAGLALILVGLNFISSETAWPGVWTLLPAVGTVLLLVAGLNKHNRVSQFLGTKPFVLVGDWSYSLYLWHWPFIVFAGVLWPENGMALFVAAVASAVPALVVFYKVENRLRFAPIQNFKKAALVGLVFLLVPALSLGGLLIGANTKWGIEWGSAIVQSEHIGFSDCVDKAFSPSLCTFNAGNTAGTVLLIGDSQAYSYADGVADAANGLGFSTIVTSATGCPFGSLDSSETTTVDCVSWKKQVLDYALSTSPTLVVIANRSSGYTMPESGWRTLFDEKGVRATPQNAQALYEQSLLGVVGPLVEAKTAVLILQNIPSMPNASPGRSGYIETIFAKFLATNSTAEFSDDVALELAQRGREAESAVSDLTGAHLFDPFPVLCNQAKCQMFIDNERIYQDYGHLSPRGSLALSDALRPAISNATRG
jgi:hypothetical protein